MTDRELMQQALEALENGDVPTPENVGKNLDAITALRERLAQPEQPSVPWSAALESVWGEPDQEPTVKWKNTVRALTDQCAALIWERDELQKQVWRYERYGTKRENT